jgi:hypothetical protein
MAFTHFYVQSGGSNLNAGSTTDNAALFTYAAGTFVRATGVYTVASGNPLTDGVTVGTYASVYTTAGGIATFVAQITARDATTITVDVATLKWGVATSVSETALAATLKVGGAWASEIVLAATGLGTFTAPVSTKINIKQATYTVVASRTISMAGATTAPIWFSGYNTTPGDVDADTTNALSKPVLAFNSTFALISSGTHQIWSGISLTGAVSGTVWTHSGTQAQFSRCRSENTSANAAAIGFTPSGANGVFAYCWWKTPTTATTTGTVSCGATQTFVGCVAEGGGIAGFNASTNVNTFAHCVGLNNTGSGFLNSTGNSKFLNCTVYGASADGIKWSGTPAQMAYVIGCLFDTCGGIGINNGSGTNTNLVFRSCNDFHACTGGDEVGFGDSPARFGQTDASSVVTSSTDMTPVAASDAPNNGFPAIFENQTSRSYLDIGAVQRRGGGGRRPRLVTVS